MSTALFVTSVLGLVPLLIRGDHSAQMTPFETTLDMSLRIIALWLGLFLVGYVVEMELERDPWNAAAQSVVGLLVGWLLLTLGAQFSLVARHRLWRSFRGQREPRRESLGADATNPVFLMSLVMSTSLALSLVGIAIQPRDFGADATYSLLFSVALACGILLMACVWAFVRVFTGAQSGLAFGGVIARGLDGRPGRWIKLEIAASASGEDATLSARVWEEAGQWYWLLPDVSRLVRFRSYCAAAAARPSVGLHSRRMTYSWLRWGDASRRMFGVRVWTTQEHGLFGRWRAHRSHPFEVADYGELSDKLHWRLVPMSAGLLGEAGLTAVVVEEA